MAKHKGPGKADRVDISLPKLMRTFPDNEAARVWFEKQIWPQGPHCPRCGSFNVQYPTKHRTMTHRCRDCPRRGDFSLKTGTLMEGSKLGYHTWAVAVCLAMTGLKGVTATKLHRDLEITQKSAWHLAHRIRKAIEGSEAPMFAERHNIRNADTADQMAIVAQQTVGKRLRYRELVA